MDIRFDLHFDETGAQAATQRGVIFLGENRSIRVLEDLYATATKEGLRVSFENKDVYERLTAINAFYPVETAIPCVSIY